MSAYFDDPRLKAAFTFQDVYMGLSPFEAPATFSMMPYTELAHGVWYPKGGMYCIVEASWNLPARPAWNLCLNTLWNELKRMGSDSEASVLPMDRA